MDKQTIKLAIAAADSAGMASGFAQGITQVCDNLTKQVELWRGIETETRAKCRKWFWNIIAPWGIGAWLRTRREAADLRAAIAALSELDKVLRASVKDNHNPEADKRRAMAQQYTEAALKPGRIDRALTALGGAAKRIAPAK